MRLDVYLVEKGLAPTREKAQALIMAGMVTVDGRVVDKPGFRLKGTEKVELKEGLRYVSRGGYKLEYALERFQLDVKGMVALDVGSSTGGFTHCLLQRGVERVYAVDVGRGQMDYLLRQDPRVILYEETDARELTEEHIPEKVDLITVDVSFISATKVLPHVVRFLKEDGFLLLLVKPQFELDPSRLRKGIVKKEEDKVEAILKVSQTLKDLGFYPLGIIKAKPKGAKGNEEFFLLAKRTEGTWDGWEEKVKHAVKEIV
ncbi:hemolysin A [Thermocrinis albus DSM 14484]|uniref:Hemolysin A n=1 Tax=Thermocrinis albus (strain DSM 14484 / JCM 11386 / HI 11/12) TaxID=638303 RepID=D3SQD5_THEAH|nr:TlyA family RNA methyltransferase [Thermocrinis albus]ADC89372.1 hemolysin A [Thermocrinis albus DSM 14484]